MRQDLIKPDMVVMVPVGGISADLNGHPVVICLATVLGPAEDEEVWWLAVQSGGGSTELPQMYRAAEILGVPALGLAMVSPDPGGPITPGLTTVEIKAWQSVSPITILPTEPDRSD